MTDWSVDTAWLLDADEQLSAGLFDLVKCRNIFLMMEWLVHGIPWLIGASTMILFGLCNGWDDRMLTKYAVFLFGIVLDLTIVGLLKISVQRGRPHYNRDDQVYEAPVADKFSFPSGHSSRAAMLAVLMCKFGLSNGAELSLVLFFPPLLALSRVMMGRHYVSDVVAGLLLGILEGQMACTLPDGFFQFLIICARVVLTRMGLR